MVYAARLLLLSQRLCRGRSAPLRRMSDYIKPNFKGGEAEPHKLMDQLKQLAYKDGEPVLSFFGAVAIIGFVAYKVRYMPERLEKEEEWCRRNCQTMMNYPLPERDTS